LAGFCAVKIPKIRKSSKLCRSSVTPGVRFSDLALSPSRAVPIVSGAVHLLAALAICNVLPRGVALFLLLGALFFGYGLQWFRFRQLRDSLLCWGAAEGWQVAPVSGDPFPVSCRVEFLSSMLVVVKVAPSSGGRPQRWVLTRESGSPDSWRRLHLVLRQAGLVSGMADDDVLSGKVDGHKDRISGNL